MCSLVSLFASKLGSEQRKFLQQKERDKTCKRNRCGDFRQKTRVAGRLLQVGKQLWLRPSTNQHLSVLTLLPSHLYLKALLPGSCSTPVHLLRDLAAVAVLYAEEDCAASAPIWMTFLPAHI
jgi:hypothetical protein